MDTDRSRHIGVVDIPGSAGSALPVSLRDGLCELPLFAESGDLALRDPITVQDAAAVSMHGLFYREDA